MLSLEVNPYPSRFIFRATLRWSLLRSLAVYGFSSGRYICSYVLHTHETELYFYSTFIFHVLTKESCTIMIWVFAFFAINSGPLMLFSIGYVFLLSFFDHLFTSVLCRPLCKSPKKNKNLSQ